MQGQLACLAEGLRAALVWALEGLLPGVDVGVFFQVLAKSEFLETNHAHILLSRGVR